VLLLTPSREPAFAGHPALAAPYFETLGFRRLPAENPADWLIDIVAGRAPRELGGRRGGGGGGSGGDEGGEGEASGHLAALEDSLDLPELWRGSGAR
jgi:predicted PhzF superfamily epimerase YddE/YHI9